MGLMDNLKAKMGQMKGKGDDAVREHGDTIGRGMDSAGKKIDEKTGGKHSDQIDSATRKAKDALDSRSRKNEGPGS